MSLPTVADLKAHANITSSTNDDELVDMLDAAVDVVEGIVGPLTSRTVTEVHPWSRSGTVLLRRMPVLALSSVSVSGAAQTLADYRLDADAGVVHAPSSYGDLTVTYTVGRPVVPAAIRLAILVVAAHLWETQRGTSPSALSLQNPDAVGDFPTGQGYAIPNRAKDLLAAYVRPAIA